MDGSWFHQALERVNATQADLARHLRLAPSAVSRMMKGERQMKLLEAVQIASTREALSRLDSRVRFASATDARATSTTTSTRTTTT